MKSFLTSVHMVFVCILVGCGKDEIAVSGDASPKCEIQAAIDELPQRLNCRQWQETEWFVYSNICCAVRQIDDRGTRMRYSTAYTNKVWGIMSAAASGRDSEALENWRINLENYIAMVRWGFVLLNENGKMEVNTWDFLLGPLILIRKEIDSHKEWLRRAGKDSRHVEKNYHVRMLGDLLDNCQREISSCWYGEAKRKMSAWQLVDIRQKIKNGLGKLPPGIENDTQGHTNATVKLPMGTTTNAPTGK